MITRLLDWLAGVPPLDAPVAPPDPDVTPLIFRLSLAPPDFQLWAARRCYRRWHEMRRAHQVFIIPNGQAEKTEPCFICGRLPELWEDGFMVYGKPVCEECYWETGNDEFERLLGEARSAVTPPEGA